MPKVDPLPSGTPEQPEDDINAVDPATGMSHLHVAVGTNQLDLVRSLVASGARFFPDKHGRWPSTIAAICEVDENLMDYVVEEENLAVFQQERGSNPPDIQDYLREKELTRPSDDTAARLIAKDRKTGKDPSKERKTDRDQ
jgi:hypothetical protein